MIQSQENGKKPHLEPDLGSLSPNSPLDFFAFFQAIILCNLKES